VERRVSEALWSEVTTPGTFISLGQSDRKPTRQAGGLHRRAEQRPGFPACRLAGRARREEGASSASSRLRLPADDTAVKRAGVGPTSCVGRLFLLLPLLYHPEIRAGASEPNAGGSFPPFAFERAPPERQGRRPVLGGGGCATATRWQKRWGPRRWPWRCWWEQGPWRWTSCDASLPLDCQPCCTGRARATAGDAKAASVSQDIGRLRDGI
jgi:hypothetical protein